MSKFVLVNKAPDSLPPQSVVIATPNFMKQVEASFLRHQNRNQTALNQLRDMLSSIQTDFGVDLNVPKIPLSRYEGLPYTDRDSLSRIVVQLLKTERPDSFVDFLEYNIRTRPLATKLIYFVGRHQETAPFFKNGIDIIDEKDVPEYMGLKAKKPGRPPASKEEETEQQ